MKVGGVGPFLRRDALAAILAAAPGPLAAALLGGLFPPASGDRGFAAAALAGFSMTLLAFGSGPLPLRREAGRAAAAALGAAAGIAALAPIPEGSTRLSALLGTACVGTALWAPVAGLRRGAERAGLPRAARSAAALLAALLWGLPWVADIAGRAGRELLAWSPVTSLARYGTWRLDLLHDPGAFYHRLDLAEEIGSTFVAHRPAALAAAGLALGALFTGLGAAARAVPPRAPVALAAAAPMIGPGEGAPPGT